MENIIEPTMDFDFSKLYLASPSSLTGGAYFTRIFFNNKPLYIQTPKSLTKQGFVKSGKKIYTDLMFDNNDTILINWLENLEFRCQELIHEKGIEWFESQLEKSDIESAFTPTMKLYKSGKFYLLRVNVKSNVKIYNDVDEIINLENIKNETNIISILEIQGIKFTSRNFQIEIELKQSMVVSPDPFLDECFIKKPLSSIKKNPVYLGLEEIKDDKKVNFDIESPLVKVDSKMNPDYDNYNDNDSDNLIEEKIGLGSGSGSGSESESDLFPESLSNSNELKEINFEDDIDINMEPLTLQKPNEVYYKIYKAAREKAKQAKKEAIIAYLEAKNIKKTYMLDDLEESDSDLDNISEVSENELEE
jgi:hypothetical protein